MTFSRQNLPDWLVSLISLLKVSSLKRQPISNPDRSARQREIDFLDNLPHADYDDSEASQGIFANDEIERYVHEYKMIEPFEIKNLKPASYELRVGERCLVGKKYVNLLLPENKRSLDIEPFEVVIIQTLERVNMPSFVIGRWNVRVKWAYEGLLWVGGPQVDPGFTGYLFCPLYNLSDKPVRLNYGDSIATIDFAKTTKPGARTYPSASERSRIVLEDYDTGLRSALATKVQDRIKEFDTLLKQQQQRNDLFLTLTFAAVSIIVGAVTVLATKQDHSDWRSSDVTIVLTSLLALLATFQGRLIGKNDRPVMWWSTVAKYCVAVLLIYLIFTSLHEPDKLNSQVVELRNQLKSESNRAQSAEAQVTRQVHDIYRKK